MQPRILAITLMITPTPVCLGKCHIYTIQDLASFLKSMYECMNYSHPIFMCKRFSDVCTELVGTLSPFNLSQFHANHTFPLGINITVEDGWK